MPPGEPAINPVPRRMIRDAIAEVAAAVGRAADAEVEISIPGGEALAAKTLNGRLGIVGGLSILGTTGIVVPVFLLGVDPFDPLRHRRRARRRLTHIAGATGASSEAAVQKLYGLPEIALIDMGDFVGGMLKYLRRHPVPRVTIAGGVAKMTKLAQGLTRSAFQARRGRPCARWRARAASAGGSANLRRRIRGGQHRRRSFALRRPKALRSATLVARAAQRHRRARVVAGRDIADRDCRVRPRREIWSAARRSSLRVTAHAAPPRKRRR